MFFDPAIVSTLKLKEKTSEEGRELSQGMSLLSFRDKTAKPQRNILRRIGQQMLRRAP
jgi:hypothetical protein